MTEQRAPLPTVVFWFRVYAGFMIALYAIILVAGIILTWFGRSRSFEETGFLLGRVHTKERVGNQGEVDEEHEDYIELVEAREDSPVAL